MLAEALFDERRRGGGGPIPKRLYRGLRHFSKEQQAAYEALVGRRVYLHSFTSTSADAAVAMRFAQPSGWRLVIDLDQPAECVAAVHKRAECDEREILISANAGSRRG